MTSLETQVLKLLFPLFVMVLIIIGITHAPLFKKTDDTAVSNYIETAPDPIADHVPGDVLVKFKSGTPQRFIVALKEELGVTEEKFIESISVFHWAGTFNTAEAVKILQSSEHVEYAEPNFRVQTQTD